MSNAKVFNQDVAYAFYTNEEYVENLVYNTQYSLFYIYENGHYKKLTPEDFRKVVISFIRKNFPRQNWTIHAIKDIVSWIEHECIRQTDHEDRHLIAFRDCLYNTKTFECEEFSRDKMVTYYLPYFYEDIKSPTPNFDRFINTSLVHKVDFTTDPTLIAVVQEMLGSFFLDNLKASKAFFLYGESGQNGKSTFTKLVRKIIGNQFCSALALSNLGEKFGLAPLIGMKVNIRDELDDKFGSSKIFKELVTGERVADQHKYGQPFEFENRAKFLFSSNVIATFDGIDNGLRRRLLFIPFYREFKDGDIDKDYDLDEKLEKEIPGIVGWALEGAKRLVSNSYKFSDSKAVKTAMDEFDDDASSAIRFFRECYTVDAEMTIWVPINKVYEDYIFWMQTEGTKKFIGKKRFLKDIKVVWRNIETKIMRSKYDDFNLGKHLTHINCYRKEDMEDSSDVITVNNDEELAEQLNIKV